MTTTTQSSKAPAGIQQEERAIQPSALMKYDPKSRASFKLNTLIPRNMAFEAQQALNNVERTHGNIDEFVSKALNYASKEALWKALAAEQVDSLALYLNQFENEQGIIIADKTGIGKGRQAAAVIRHAVLKGYLPIFFTRKPDLFTDIYRDLANIGFADIHPFLLNSGRDAIVKDKNGKEVFYPLSRQEQMDLLLNQRTVPTDSEISLAYHKKNNLSLPDFEKQPEVLINEPLTTLPDGYDMIFTTYSQIQSAHESKQQWLHALIENGVEGSSKHQKVILVLDESHIAGGFTTRVGNWMRSVIPKTKSCCFLSATFAKYAEIMPLYMSKTAISETRMNSFQFVSALKKGGLALQEIIASQLVESGQLIRRERSNKGININYHALDKEPFRTESRRKVDSISVLMRRIVKFESDFVKPYTAAIHRTAMEAGEKVENKPADLGVKSAPFFSRVFNIIDQLLFSLKVEQVAELAIRLLEKDKKVVIAFKSTMGSYLADLGLASGDQVLPEQLDFARTLLKALESTLNYTYTDIEGQSTRYTISLDELPALAKIAYNNMVSDMLSASSGLSTSPIDELIFLIESKKKKAGLGGQKGNYYKVAEVTGRNQRIRLNGFGGEVESFRPSPEKSFRAFNSGDIDVLLINQSGSTGFSAHASEEFTDQRQRHMISHQFELDVNIEVQKWGRINRTGQVELPEYHYVISDIPIEKRLMTMLKSKLRALDANTTASQQTSDSSLESPDFFNKYGDLVAWEWVDDNPVMSERLYYPTYQKDWEGNWERKPSMEGSMKQVTGRSGLLTVKEQDQLFDELLERYRQQVAFEKQSGTYDLEVEYLPLDAEVLERYLYQDSLGGKSTFGKAATREISKVNNLSRPYTKTELDEKLNQALSGKSAKAVQADLVEKIEQEYPDLMQTLKKAKSESTEQLSKEINQLRSKLSQAKTEVGQKLNDQIESLQYLLDEQSDQLKTLEKTFDTTLKSIVHAVKYFKVGDVVQVPGAFSKSISWGVFTGVSMRQSVSNPYTLNNISLVFATTDERRSIAFKIAGKQRELISHILTRSNEVDQKEKEYVLDNWDLITEQDSGKRIERHIVTGNILAVSDQINQANRLIKYNKIDGIIENGILLHKDFVEKGGHLTKSPISKAFQLISELSVDELFFDGSQAIRFLKVSESLLKVYLKKSGQFNIYTDDRLRNLLERSADQNPDELPEFVQSAGEMVGILSTKRLKSFLFGLDQFGIVFLEEAKKLEKWEAEEESAGKKVKKGNYTYGLETSFQSSTYPDEGFKRFEPPTDNHPYGLLIYEFPLTISERKTHQLTPVFQNVAMALQSWKSADENPISQTALEQLVEKAKEQPLTDAFKALGDFVIASLNNPDEARWWFGDFSARQLGRALYEERIKKVEPIDEYIEQLQAQLQLAA